MVFIPDSGMMSLYVTIAPIMLYIVLKICTYMLANHNLDTYLYFGGLNFIEVFIVNLCLFKCRTNVSANTIHSTLPFTNESCPRYGFH